MSRLLTAALLGLLGVGLATAQDSAGLPLEPRGPGFGQRMTRFGGGIALGEYAHAVARGDAIGADLARSAPLTPEFMTSLVVFDAGMQLGDRALAKAVPGGGRVGSVLKHNLALAGAMALTQAVEVDFGGFTAGDALRGDFSELRETRVRVHDVDAGSLGITLGVFAAWGPTYEALKQGAKRVVRRVGAKRLLGHFAKQVAKRFVRGAAARTALAVAPVPGSRLALLAWTALDVALAIADTAVLLQTAHAIEAPLQRANDARQARAVVADEAAAASRAARDGDPQALEQALQSLHAARAAQRNLAYLPIAQADHQLIAWLRERGADPAEFDALAQQVYADYGPGLALPALSAALRRRLAAAVSGEQPLPIPTAELARALASYTQQTNALRVDVRSALQLDADSPTDDREAQFLSRLQLGVGSRPQLAPVVTAARQRADDAAQTLAWLLQTDPDTTPSATEGLTHHLTWNGDSE